MGIVLVVICAVIFLGGVQRLAAVTELVPVMAAHVHSGRPGGAGAADPVYSGDLCHDLPLCLCPNAIIGGGLGAALKIAISQGAKRGLFSNEAGMGSTPHAHALANVSCPHDQGVVAMIGVFIDTFVVLTLNALVIISTMYTASDGPLAPAIPMTVAATIDNTNLAQNAFGSVMAREPGRHVRGCVPVLLRLFHHPGLELVR